VKVIPSQGISAPKGFMATGLACGIKISGKKDLGLVFSETPAAVAAAFTKNQVVAAPVTASRENLGPTARAVIACTGRQGLEDAWSMIDLTAGKLGVDPHEVLVASTGVIGQPLPMDKIKAGLARLQPASGANADSDFARAIMTTDAFPKQLAVRIELSGGEVLISGATKGAGMIAPDMAPHATMLTFITTDAPLEREALSEYLTRAVDKSFNAITVDGDTSTNDSVFALANGAAGDFALTDKDKRVFQEGLDYLCLQLAKMIVRDGEGATKIIGYKVVGAKTAADAAAVARTLANSLLVKTAFFGGDPNWGRLLAAAGRAGVELDPGDLDIDINGLALVRSGQAADTAPEKIAGEMRNEEIQVWINLNRGGYQATVYGCDLSYDYVKINAEYHT
jgi:glutamate N-acetyltransferase/amino-acid N-acetyltransferase